MKKIYLSGVEILTPNINNFLSIANINNSTKTKKQTIEDDIIPFGMTNKELRHMSKLTKMSLFTAKSAFLNSDPIDSGIFFGLMHGSNSMLQKFNDYIFDYGPDLTSPICFSNGVLNAPLAAISTILKIHNGGTTLVGHENIGIEIFELAYLSIINNQFTNCIIGASEEFSKDIELMHIDKNIQIPNYLFFKSKQKICFPIIEASAFFLAKKEPCINTICSYTPLKNIFDLHNIDLIISGASNNKNDKLELRFLKSIISKLDARKKTPILFSKPLFGETFAVSSLLSISLAMSILKHKTNFQSYPINQNLMINFTDKYNPDKIFKILILSTSSHGQISHCILEKMH